MRVEICDTHYFYKIIIPETDREVKCLARLRKFEKRTLYYDKKSPAKYTFLIKNLIETYGIPVGIHIWISYSMGGMRREREHVVYEISDWLRNIIEKIIEISKLNMTRKLPDDLYLLSREEIERMVNEVLEEGLAKKVAEEIMP